MKNKRSKLYPNPGTPRPPPVCVLSGFWCFCANKLLYCFVLYCIIILSDGFLSETKQLRFTSDKIPTLEFKNSSDKFQIRAKMVKISAQNISEAAIQKYYMEYMSRGINVDDGDSCEICNLPKLFHIDERGEIILGPCDTYTSSEKIEIWRIFRHKIRSIRKWYKEILEKREEDKIKYLNEFTLLTEDILNGDKNLEDLQNIYQKLET